MCIRMTLEKLRARKTLLEKILQSLECSDGLFYSDEPNGNEPELQLDQAELSELYHKIYLELKMLEIQIYDLSYLFAFSGGGVARLRDEIRKISIGTTAKIELFGEILEITLVTILGDLTDGMISIKSPVGEKLLGRTSGEIFEVTTPQGSQRIKVLEIVD